jgi:phospholipase/lecithinase/hemolysin
MENLETKNAIVADPDDVKQQCAALQRQVTTLLLALVIVSGTLTVFLYIQARHARADLAAVKQPAAQIIQAFNRQDKSNIDSFVIRLAEYGRTHPDFVPILNKYKIAVPAVPVTTSAPPATVAPKPAAAPKK